MLETMKVFKALNAALLLKDQAQQRQSDEAMKDGRLRLDAIPAKCIELASL
jgi:hypothetical protein